MRILRRNKRKLYLCQKYQDGLIDKYKEPIELYENYLPTNNEGDLISLGMSYPMFLRIKTTLDRKELYHAGDRIYIYNELPEEHDVLCKNADYEIYKDPMIFLNEMEIMLHKLSGDGDEEYRN